MKTIQRLLSVSFLMILLAGILVMPANAASITQDGLVITLETDKKSYAQDELIHATATVKNTNSTDVSAVSIEPLIPAGYELTIRDSSSQSTVLKAGEIMTSTFVLEPQIGSNTAVAASQTLTHAEETPAPEAAQPASRSSSVLPIIIVAVLVIVLLAVVILSGVWKRFLALLLCSAMLYTSLPSVALQADAAEQNVRTAKISTDITVGDKKVTLEAHVSYEQPVDVVTVSFNTNNGSTTASVSVEKGKSISKPANPTRSGYTFLGWFLDRALTRKFRFSDPITESITLYAG